MQRARESHVSPAIDSCWRGLGWHSPLFRRTHWVISRSPFHHPASSSTKSVVFFCCCWCFTLTSFTPAVMNSLAHLLQWWKTRHGLDFLHPSIHFSLPRSFMTFISFPPFFFLILFRNSLLFFISPFYLLKKKNFCFYDLGLCHQDMTSLPPLLYHLRTCLRGKRKSTCNVNMHCGAHCKLTLSPDFCWISFAPRWHDNSLFPWFAHIACNSARFCLSLFSPLF